MKTFLLAATVAAGLLCSASTADAQFRYRGGRSYVYSYPTYSYTYPNYYSSGVVTASSYTPIVNTNTGVVVTSGYTPTYSSYYGYPSYTYPSNYSGYYNNGYYYNGGSYISPSSGVIVGGRRIWRW